MLHLCRLLTTPITILVAVLSLTSTFAQAEVDLDHPKPRAKIRKHTTTVIERDEDSIDDPDHEKSDSSNTEADGSVKERVLTAKFGAKSAGAGVTAGCKTEELSQKVVKGLKADCNAWLKDRKAELKDKYVVGSCDDSCEDCGMHLQRCSVDGSVRYR